ncbi:MAG: non-heme haloperoxidase family protein [Firmicutes bacterium]|nr:non-heme haloperoxidase family protein [Bacillota bacterium]
MGYYINVEPEVNLYVEDLNPEGKNVILFLHGWPGSHELFEYQFNKLASQGFRCIGLDQRGFGKSDRPLTGYGYDRLADDVRCIIDTLELHDIMLLGHSTGGSIAVRYMSRHHAYGVRRLVLCAAAAPSLIRRPDFPYGVPKEVIQDMIHTTYTDRPKMLQDFGANFFFRSVSPALMDWFFQLGLAAAGWATAAVENTWIEEVLFTDLERITTPTLIMHGIHDHVVPFTLAEIQNKMIRNSILHPFECCGHGFFIEEMDRFNKEVAHFALS